MLKVLYPGCPDLSLAILVQFTLEMCTAAKNCKKNTKTPILRVQSHSRSSMLTPLKSSSLVLVMVSSMALPIYNRFHATRANSSKITTSREYAFLTPACTGLIELWGSRRGLLKSTAH